jgi:hypothetical protein
VRRRLVVVVTFLAGIYFFFEFFLPSHILVGNFDFQWSRYDERINDVARVMGVPAMLLGIINILRVHGFAIVRRRKGWPNSAALLVAMFATFFFGLWGSFGENEAADSFFQDFLFSGMMNNLGAAMFSLLAFYIASAAYRSFRVQSMEAGLLMVAALLVMLGQIPLGFYVWEELPRMRNWLMTRINAPAFRGIMFGALIAGLAMAVRMWWSLERTSARGSGGAA